MRHYVCTGGCGGESTSPGVCETESCPNEGKPLVPCDCEDGLHEKAGERSDDNDPELS